MTDKFEMYAEKVMALHDGELTAAEEHELRELMDRDPEVAHILDMMQRADAAFAAEAAPLLDAPIPKRLKDRVRGSPPQSAEIVQFPGRRGLIGMGIAAGLAAVVIGVQQRSPEDTAQPVNASYASLLQQMLEEIPSGEILTSSDGQSRVTAVVSYRTGDARFCREYMAMNGNAERSGIACREADGSWSIIEQRELATADEASYRTAEGDDAPVDATQTLGDATTISYSDEAALLESGWDSRP